MKILSKLIPFAATALFLAGCDSKKITENFTKVDGNFWIKVVLTIALLLLMQFILKKLRK